jgi:membrane associated rhomboid family serine protease
MSPPLLPPVIRALLIANIAVFLLELVIPDPLIEHFALWPLDTPYFKPWQPVSYAFLHESIPHIGFNMFGLFMFGRPLEAFWGGRRFALYYLACVLSAAGTELLVQNAAAGGTPVLGASGGIYGLLLGFAWYFPREKFFLLIPPVPLQAWALATIYGGIELFLGITGKQPGVAHFAHLGGMLGGAASILYWRARRRFGS